LGAGLSDREKLVLAVVCAVSVLVWVSVALAIVGRRAAAPRVSPPLSYYAPTPTPSPTPEIAQPTATGVALPTCTPTPTPTSTPVVAPVGTPAADDEDLVIGDDVIVVALLGTDVEGDASIWRTDSILLVFVQPKTRQIAMLSLPRDLWVFIPGQESNRLNTVDALGERTGYPGGGPALLDQTLRRNLKLRTDHYVRVNLAGFIRIVDAMGGVTVNVEKPITDSFPDPFTHEEMTNITLSAGPHYMDGRLALSYCRSRMTTDDFDRSRRQQQVLMALWRKVFTLDTLLKAPTLWTEFRDSFETDMTMVEAVQLAYVAWGIGLENVRTASLDYRTARPWRTSRGAQVLLPQVDDIDVIILDLLSPPAE
jgi:polyisoprenyl-teichoic acid--peptidoglycan teichoic acid transferase